MTRRKRSRKTYRFLALTLVFMMVALLLPAAMVAQTEGGPEGGNGGLEGQGVIQADENDPLGDPPGSEGTPTDLEEPAPPEAPLDLGLDDGEGEADLLQQPGLETLEGPQLMGAALEPELQLMGTVPALVYDADTDLIPVYSASPNNKTNAKFIWLKDGDLYLALAINIKDPILFSLNGVEYTPEAVGLQMAADPTVPLTINGVDYPLTGMHKDCRWAVANFGIQTIYGSFILGIDAGPGGFSAWGDSALTVIVDSDLQVFHHYGAEPGISDLDQSGDLTPIGGGLYSYSVSPVYEHPVSHVIHVLVSIERTINGGSPQILDPSALDGSGNLTGTVPVLTSGSSAVIRFYYQIQYFTITFDKNGGETEADPPTATTTYGGTVALPGTYPTWTGYHVNGWNTASDGSGTAFTASTPVTADRTVYAQWAPNTNTPYKIEHYRQGADFSGYTLYETEDKTGTTGTTATASPKSYTGYIFDVGNAGNLTSGTIAADGSLVLKLYYNAIPYNVIYNGNGGSGTLTDPANPYLFAETVTVLGNAFSKLGYTFQSWNTAADGSGTTRMPGATFSMPAAHVTLYARWTANTNTPYKVEHYLQNADFATFALKETENLSGTTDSTATAVGKTYTGYTLDTSIAGTLASGTIAADGSLVLKLYYRANEYRVYYHANEGTGSLLDPANPYIYHELVTVLNNTFTRTGFHFTGWKTQPAGGTAYDEGDTFNMPAADVHLYAQWAPNTDTQYKVEHYLHNADFETFHLEDTDTLYGTTGTPVSATSKNYTGFTYNPLMGTTSGAIAADGSLVLKLYYEGIPYNVSYQANGGTGAMTDGMNPYLYGETVTVLANEFTRTGFHFIGWKTQPAGGTAYAEGAIFSMPAAHVTLYAQWAPNTDTAYKVEHYWQNADFMTYALHETENLTGTTGTTATAIAKTYTGYTFDDDVVGTLVSGTIAADGSLVLKLYYMANPYDVLYDANGGAGSMSDPENSYIYDEQATVLDNEFTRTGYHFDGWNTQADGEGAAYAEGDTFNMPAAHVTLFAQWAPNTDTAYKVEHYLQNEDFETFALHETENFTGTTGALATATDKTYTGYTFDGDVEGTVASGTIAADGSLVLKLYYTANPYDVIYDANEGTGTQSDPANPYRYEEEVTILVNAFSRSGYLFNGWNTQADGEGAAYVEGDSFNMPASDVTLYAQWVPREDIQYTVSYLEMETEKSLWDDKLVEDQTFGALVSEEAIVIPGYVAQEPTSQSLTLAVEDNQLTFYYVARDDLSYVVNYLEFESNAIVAPQKVVNDQTYKTLVTEEAIDVAGYDKVAPLSQELTIGLEDNVINFYYEPLSFTVTYNANGGNASQVPVDSDSPYRYKETVKVLGRGDLSRSGYTFSGWNTAANGSGTSYSPDATFSMGLSNVILYAQWSSSGGGGGGGGSSTPPPPPALLESLEHFAYIVGYPDNTVRPQANITREEVATVFYRLLQADYRQTIRTTAQAFGDVAESRWSLTPIATLAHGGILVGYPDGTFRPGHYITRAELAVIASRFDRLSELETNQFSDVAGHWAEKAINSAAEKGWVTGYPDGTFKPNQYITRAEFVTLVNNVLQRRVKAEAILPESRTFDDLQPGTWFYEAMQEAINSHLYERLEDGFELWTEIYYPDLQW